MDSFLITADGTEHGVTPAGVKELIGSGTRFWLDLSGDEFADGLPDEGSALLSETFGFHPLAVEDSEHFGQRPKVDTFDDFTLIVVYGATASGELVEVHCFYTAQYLVTVHRLPCPELRALTERIRRRAVQRADHVMLLYRVMDTLTDGFFPVLASIDDKIDELEDDILRQPTEEQLSRLFQLKRSLIAIRKVAGPQRDLLARLLTEPEVLPGMTADAERYFRDLHDHLIRIGELTDSYRDLVGGARDTHLSTVSNRLNAVMKQLTIIATIFLPLSFITGFFGQNFGWMIGHLTSAVTFAVLGIGSQVIAALFLVAYFRRKGWISAKSS